MSSSSSLSPATHPAIRTRYTATALSSPSPSSSRQASTVALAFGYIATDLQSIPPDSNLGLSCGNPLALANLKQGETVIDLGCGAGLDVFLAAKKVGQTGRVVGVDVNEHMIHRARLTATKTGVDNVQFIHSDITSMPSLCASTADVMASNCVINLIPHASKPLVFAEMHRVLKPGGRVAVSDILLKKDLPDELKGNVALLVGCIAGASQKDEYEMWLRKAGFKDVCVTEGGGDLNIYKGERGEMGGGGCCGADTDGDGGVAQDMKRELRDVDLNEWAASFKIYAVKPGNKTMM